MSAYRETGHMCAVAAPRRNVDAVQLRQLIEEAYLPRIRVVTLPSVGDSPWVPDVADLVNPHAARAHSTDA
jgi:hypothetical protein